jgi:hypothetical protein
LGLAIARELAVDQMPRWPAMLGSDFARRLTFALVHVHLDIGSSRPVATAMMTTVPTMATVATVHE